jgi:hypothetical protein
MLWGKAHQRKTAAMAAAGAAADRVVLDKALASYGAAPPATGLAGRVRHDSSAEGAGARRAADTTRLDLAGLVAGPHSLGRTQGVGPRPGCTATVKRGRRCSRPVAEGQQLCHDHLAMGWSSDDEFITSSV